MDREEARRLVAEAVLAQVTAGESDPGQQGTDVDRLGRSDAFERLGADDSRDVLDEALDLATYLGVWAQDFGASVQLVFGALPVGAGLPPAPTLQDLLREWRFGET